MAINPVLNDFAFDEDFIISPIGELAFASDFDIDPAFETFRSLQQLDTTVAILSNELQFSPRYGAGLDRLFGFTVTEHLIDFGTESITRALSEIAPLSSFNVEGYYLKSFNNKILYVINTLKSQKLSLLIDLGGDITLLGD